MNHYHRQNYPKTFTLFSKDAVRTLDSSGSKYDWYKWYNIRNFGLRPNSKLRIASIDFKDKVKKYVDISAPVPPDDMIVWYKFDGDLTDSVGGDDIVLGTGMTTDDFSDTIVEKGTQSFKFLDGGNDGGNPGKYGGNFTTPINWNTNTICFWSYQYADYEANKFWNKMFGFGDNNIVWGIGSPAGGIQPFQIRVNGNYFNTNISCSNALFKDKWVFWSFTFWKEGSDIKVQIYINGVLQQTVTYDNQSLGFTTTNAVICAGAYDGTNNMRMGFGAYIDDFRIYDRVLTSDEINRIMAEIQKDLVVHYKFDGDFNNDGTQTVTTTETGTPVISNSVYKIGTGSMLLDGNNGLEIPDNPLVGLKQLTFSMWVNLTDMGINGADQHFVFEGFIFSFRFNTYTTFRMFVADGTSWGYYYEVSLNKSSILNKWTHLTFTVDYTKTNQVAGMYVNGVELSGTHNLTLTATEVPTMYGTDFTIGFNNMTNNLGIIGYIDDSVYMIKH